MTSSDFYQLKTNAKLRPVILPGNVRLPVQVGLHLNYSPAVMTNSQQRPSGFSSLPLLIITIVI